MLLLFPLAPVCAAVTTVTIGSVVINAATDKCNSSLMSTDDAMVISLSLSDTLWRLTNGLPSKWLHPGHDRHHLSPAFLQGAVVLSYVLLWFFAYCWMGPAPIKSLRAVRVFYLLYGLACFVWWGVYGTMQAVAATSSGFESCLSTSPTLYVMAQYEVAVFWVLLLVFVGFAVNESTAKLRQEKMQQWMRRGTTFKPKTEEEIREEAARADVLAEAAERAHAAEEKQRAKMQTEQDHLYGVRENENEDDEGDDAFGDNGDEEQKNGEGDEDGDGDDDDEEEEELLLGGLAQEDESAPEATRFPSQN